MNITVRTEGIINNTLSEEQFLVIVVQIFGEGKTIDEYIKLYNEAPRAQMAMITVHKEVPDDHVELAAQEEEKFQLEAHQLEIGDIIGVDDPNRFLDAVESILGAATGKEVTIEFASDDDV